MSLKKQRSLFGDIAATLVFTPSEKRVLAFIVVAAVIGMATQHYREINPPKVISLNKAEVTKMKSPVKRPLPPPNDENDRDE